MQDKRKEPRVPIKLKVIIKKDDFEDVYYTANASRGGIFVETAYPFSLDERLEIKLFLSENEVVMAKGKVVWVSHPHEKNIYLPGMGIKFEELDIKDMEKLGIFLGKIIKAEQTVDDETFYHIEDRIIISNDDICQTNAEVVVVLAGRGVKEIVNLTKNVLDISSESLKNFYYAYGDDLNIGEPLLLPYDGKLNKPYVILVGAPTFYDAFGDELLRDAIWSVLRLASEQTFASVAIPAFSFLEIGYPLRNLAKVCLGAAYGFLKKEVFPKKVFFYSNYNNQNDLLVFQRVKKEIFLS